MSVQSPDGFGPTASSSPFASSDPFGSSNSSLLTPAPQPAQQSLVQNNTAYVDGRPVCTVNGTQAQVQTTVRSWNPEDDQKAAKAKALTEACAASPVSCAAALGTNYVQDNFAIRSAGVTGTANTPLGSATGSIKADQDGIHPEGKIDLDGKKKDDKKKSLEFNVKGEVCIMHKNGTKNGKGSWYTLDAHVKGLHAKIGVPDGDLCIGNNDGEYGGAGASVELGNSE